MTTSISAPWHTHEEQEPPSERSGCRGPRLSGGIINKIDVPNGSKKDHVATHYQRLKSLIIRFSAAVTLRPPKSPGPSGSLLSCGRQGASSKLGRPQGWGPRLLPALNTY